MKRRCEAQVEEGQADDEMPQSFDLNQGGVEDVLEAEAFLAEHIVEKKQYKKVGIYIYYNKLLEEQKLFQPAIKAEWEAWLSYHAVDVVPPGTNLHKQL